MNREAGTDLSGRDYADTHWSEILSCQGILEGRPDLAKPLSDLCEPAVDVVAGIGTLQPGSPEHERAVQLVRGLLASHIDIGPPIESD